jgi:AcrR family transcriptional regulator
VDVQKAGSEASASKPRRYTSASIENRRARIAKAARQLIIEKGPEGFTMAEISIKAGVAVKTVYNLAGGKGDLIAQAVDQYQDELRDAVYLPANYRLEDVLENLAGVCDRLIKEPEWGRAIAALYFGRDYGDEVVSKLRMVSQAHLDPCWAWLDGQSMLLARPPRNLIMRQFAGTAYALLSDWSLGRIDDVQLFPSLAFALVTALLVATNSIGRAELMRHAQTFAAEIQGF